MSWCARFQSSLRAACVIPVYLRSGGSSRDLGWLGQSALLTLTPPTKHGEVNPVQVAQCAEDVERDLQLTGVTAIEDKLQVED